MASKKGETPERKPPTVSPDQALKVLEMVLAEGKRLLERPQLSKDEHQGWELGVRHWLEKSFGEGAIEVSRVMSAGPPQQMRRASPGLEAVLARERVERVKARVSQLESAIGIIRMHASVFPTAGIDAGEVLPGPAPLDLFVSHTERDEPLVKALLDLIDRALKIPTSRVRCTSIPGYKLAGGADVSATLKYEVRHCVMFLAVLTEASNESFYVASEIGARWDAEGPAIILRGGGFTPKQVRGPLADTHSLDLSSETDLHQLVRELATHLGVKPEPPDAYLAHVRAVVAASAASTRVAFAGAAAPAAQPQPSKFPPELLERALDILGALVDRGVPATRDALASPLNLERVVTQHLLDTLTERGFIVSPGPYSDQSYSLTTHGAAHIAAKRLGTRQRHP
jgi:hypothetical protein